MSTDRYVTKKMEEIVMTGVSTYIHDFTKEIFNDYKTSGSQNTIVHGLAQAIDEYQKQTGVPISDALAYALLDLNKDTKHE